MVRWRIDQGRATIQANSQGMKARRLAAFAALLLFASPLSGCSGGTAPASTTIGIGVDLPLSGADASVGHSTLNGIKLAVAHANAKGVPGGFTFAVQALDDTNQGMHSPQQGVSNVRTLIADSSVLAIVGPYNSNVAAAEIPISNQAGIVQISPSAVSDGLTMGKDAAMLRRSNPSVNTFFRVCTTDSRQGSAAARFALDLKLKRVYIIDDNETYGLDLANVFSHDFTKLGGSVLGHDHIAPDTQDFKALLLKIKATKPDFIFFGGTTSTGGGLLRRQMADVGMGKLPFMGGDGIPDIAEVARKRADGTYYTLAAPDAEKLPAAKVFVADYKSTYGANVGPYSANAYAATQVAISAIERAIGANKEKMPTRAQVLAMMPVGGAQAVITPIGAISFDKNGDVRNPVISLYTIVHGHASFIEQLNLSH